ncbi:MAG: DUF2079 domain-containing protein [Actinobacteria bacterium]|nr:DUF2079 domain-containing protein [Actinomycetota bacterium]
MRPRRLLWVAVALYGCGFAVLSILRHRAFSTGRFDLGNMTQAVWATAHGHPLAVTSLEGEQFVRLGAHVDPLLVLLAPLWWLWPSPELLLTVQAIAIALGAVPLYWLACKHLASERAALGFALAFLLLPALQWMTLSEFHPVALATPLLLLALWYLDEERLVPFALVALLAAGGKEHIPLALAGLGVWHALSRRRLWPGAAIVTGGVALSAVAVGVVMPRFRPEGSEVFLERYGEVGGSPGGILSTTLTDPGAVLGEALDGPGLALVAQLVLPLAGLSLLAPLALLGGGAELVLNLLSASRAQTSIHYHYSAATLAALAGAAVLGTARLSRLRPRLAEAAAALVLAVSLASNYVLGPLPIWRLLPGSEQLGSGTARITDRDRVAAEAVRQIPPDAVVTASNSLGAHLSERRRILSWPLLGDATWVAVDGARPGPADRIAPVQHARAIGRLRSDRAWRLVFQRDGMLVFRRQS